MARRQRIDSATGAVQTMAAAARDLEPPKHLKLRRGDMPFWDAVIKERAKSEWTDSDMAVAANLARAMADAERIAGYPVDRAGNVKITTLISTIEMSDKPVVESLAMAANQFLLGAFAMAAQIFDREDITVQMSTEDRDNFVKNMVTILAEGRLALAVYRPAALIKGNFTGAN